jgi:glycosyltransferase involved in cell wall biosynthesis
MKILLASGASYAPPKGGSTRSNLVWLRGLAAQGHTMRVVCSAAPDTGLVEQDGLSISRVADLALHAGVLGEEIRAFAPDWVLVSSEDVSQRLLREAERHLPGRLIYLAHTPQFFPFGRESWNPDAEATRIIERAAGVVAIGKHMAGYIAQYCSARPVVIHPPIYGNGPYADFRSFDRGLILMINPCVVKGIEIFLALARRFPNHQFGALAGWGTTASDRSELERLPNVRVIPGVRNIEEVLSQARLLLMPSLWYEGFGLIVMEAMLRGVPVIASDSGGLSEAKEGTGSVVPVRAIARYEPVFDENHMPRPVTEAQDIGPWEEELRELLTNRQAYDEEASRSRAAAIKFVEALRPEAFEDFLKTCKPRLTAAQHALLAQRLKQRTAR